MTMGLLRRAFLVLAIMVALGFCLPARTAEEFLGVSDLATEAGVVVRAEIIGLSSGMADTPKGRFPFITYRARSIETIEGSCPQEFTIRVPGMIRGDRIISSADSPQLSVGLQFLMFLRPAYGSAAGSGEFELVSLSQASLLVAAPEGEAEPLVMVPVRNPDVTKGRTHVQVRLSDLKSQVKAIKEKKNSGGEKK